MVPNMFNILLNGQIVATSIQELVKPIVDTIMSMVGPEFDIRTELIKTDMPVADKGE